MQGLMYRLAELDADSAGLVRVIDYFDALVRHGADTVALMRASAALANCVVGIETTGKSGNLDVRRCDSRGNWSPQPVRPRTVMKDIMIGDAVVGRVWIERIGDQLPLDEMLVDRMALTAASILQPRRPLTDAEHTRNLLVSVDQVAVLTACASLRIEPSTTVRVLVSSGEGLAIPREAAPGRATGIEMDGDHMGLVLDSYLPLHLPELAAAASAAHARVGVSLAAEASEIHLLVASAQFAKCQTSGATPVVSADDLGAMVLLAPGSKVGQERIPDMVRALEVRSSEHGVELLETLKVYLQSGTLRTAADALFLHHSSVAHRLAKLSQHLGFRVDSIEYRARSMAMIMLLADGQGSSLALIQASNRAT
ncbi:helix-turn-helix domain-containing protein [Paenarthrobacter sp. NPDC092416]|uniref:helix-turn-helix domain-containing protein n=1 Tax=Paenarthrobacter sp. NPDC092416 TaxID=3364386 RepID=UPI0037F9B5B3